MGQNVKVYISECNRGLLPSVFTYKITNNVGGVGYNLYGGTANTYVDAIRAVESDLKQYYSRLQPSER